MDYFSFIILLDVSVLVAIQYLLEVHVGSSACMYDGEAGVLSEDCLPRRSSRDQFFGRLVPLQLLTFALPLLVYDRPAGVLLGLIALLLFFLYRQNRFIEA